MRMTEMFEINESFHVVFEHTGIIKNLAQGFTLAESVVTEVIIDQNLLSHFQLSDLSAKEKELSLSINEEKIKLKFSGSVAVITSD